MSKYAEMKAGSIAHWDKHSGLYEKLVEAIDEAMRDQRHACAESLTTCGRSGEGIRLLHAHQAVMNATVKEPR